MSVALAPIPQATPRVTDVRGAHDEAEPLFRRAVAERPDLMPLLADAANFLTDVRGAHDEAEAMYRRAVAANPDDPINLGNYAAFLAHRRGDLAGAEALLRRALVGEPDDPNNLANLAQVLFLAGEEAEARSTLARAIPLADTPALRCEVWFYAHAHARDDHPHALAELRRLVTTGGRSPGWGLAGDLERARAQGHPDLDLLVALAEVITHGAPPDTLDAYAAWRQAAPSAG